MHFCVTSLSRTFRHEDDQTLCVKQSSRAGSASRSVVRSTWANTGECIQRIRGCPIGSWCGLISGLRDHPLLQAKSPHVLSHQEMQAGQPVRSTASYGCMDTVSQPPTGRVPPSPLAHLLPFPAPLIADWCWCVAPSGLALGSLPLCSSTLALWAAHLGLDRQGGPGQRM